MNTLKGKFISLFAVLIVVSIGGGVFNTISKQKSDGVVINLAGRQRMLSQKFTKEFLDELNVRQIAAASEELTSVATRQIVSDPGHTTLKTLFSSLRRNRLTSKRTPTIKI